MMSSEPPLRVFSMIALDEAGEIRGTKQRYELHGWTVPASVDYSQLET